MAKKHRLPKSTCRLCSAAVGTGPQGATSGFRPASDPITYFSSSVVRPIRAKVSADIRFGVIFRLPDASLVQGRGSSVRPELNKFLINTAA